jgi:hypothetical protein
MNNQNDTFEAIAADAVDLLTAIIADLAESDDVTDNMAADIIAATAASFCERAIALGAE